MTQPEMTGVDVSKWQGSINWAAAAPVTGFEMVKSTQGTAEQDAQYGADILALRQRGEPRGSYHYPDAGDPAAEADFYVLHTGRQAGELQALDFEGAVLSLADPVGWAAAFLARVIALTDNVPLIYMSGSTVTAHDWSRVIALGCGLWCADWGVGAPVHGQWPFAIMWQTSSTGSEPGIAGNVDTDVFFGNGATWAAYGRNRSTSPPKPNPVPPPRPVPAAGHTVVAGDTLSGIAAANGTSVAELVALNRAHYPSLVANPNLIQIGWHLATKSAPASSPAPKQEPAPAPARTHTVVAGDTLSGIAAAAGLDLAAVERLNPNITDPNYIQIGWVIKLS